MTEDDAFEVCTLIATMCPNQSMKEGTPVAWARATPDIPGPVAIAAALYVARRKPYVALCDIVTVASRMRTLTRRAVSAAAREFGVRADIAATADAAIAAGAARFDGIDLFATEDADTKFYNPQMAALESWAPARLGLTA